MYAFRCNRCGADSYSAASLERLSAGDRCSHCGGELERTARSRLFGAPRPGRPRAATEGSADARRGAA